MRQLLKKIEERDAMVGIVGLGYVGLPLGLEFCGAGFNVLGFDIDDEKVRRLNAGESYVGHIPDAAIEKAIGSERFESTSDFSRVPEADAILICVPTPLTPQREPDTTFIHRTADTLAEHIRPGQLIVLESTTYPGTTEEILRPALEKSGLTPGEDFFVAYSPEREDPGNEEYTTSKIPKVIGADDPQSRQLAEALYDQVVVDTLTVSSTKAAEAVKLLENIFRSVNIALVNELKVVYNEMGIDVWEVIEAAKTKPFGFMPFYPGPGLGGHCVPIDPFYLTWKAREFGCTSRFIEHAGEVNASMPRYVLRKLTEQLNARGKPLNGSRVLLLGVAYKKNVDDDRESPAYELFDLLRQHNADVSYHDPYVPEITPPRKYPYLGGTTSVPLNEEELAGYDAVVIVTDHSNIDYGMVVEASELVIDARNATQGVREGHDHVVLA